MQNEISVFWFRRDLRLFDNHGLSCALQEDQQVLPIFIFDTDILSQLETDSDARVDFIVDNLAALNQTLAKNGRGISVFYGTPREVFEKLFLKYKIAKIFCNEDYEPYAVRRDAEIAELAAKNKVEFCAVKDQVIFHKDEILKADGSPYTVFTPYSKQWLAKFKENPVPYFGSEKMLSNLIKNEPEKISREKLGFQPSNIKAPPVQPLDDLLPHYAKTRYFPAIPTSERSVHLRFGTVSVRAMASEAAARSEVFLKELIWREFFMQVLFHFPRVVNHSFKPEYDGILWRSDESDLRKWQRGETGFPLVDAGMRQLNETGYLPNRVRMVCASFLTKHLLIDWRIGETYFAQKLLDYDLAANNGNWQWVAGTGCDAAPYFRIFNPETQQKKFDPDFKYIKKWVKDFGTVAYPKPMVDHKFARERALEAYKKALSEKK